MYFNEREKLVAYTTLEIIFGKTTMLSIILTQKIKANRFYLYWAL